MKPLFRIAIVCLALLASIRVYFVLTDDFRLANITYPLPIEHYDNANPIPELFHQPYHYLGKGAQTYVFLSEDGQYVLKFFKFKHIKPSIFDSEKKMQRKKRKLERLFAGYRLANQYQIPGLAYIHLNTGTQSEPVVTVYDKIGIPRKISLDQVVFIVQKAGKTFEQELYAALKKQDVDHAKELIARIFDLYYAEYKQGIYDRDHRVMDNMGFTAGDAFHIDVGMLTESPTIAASNFEDMEKVAYTINRWIHKKFSRHSAELQKFMEGKLSEHYNRHFRFDKSHDDVLKHTN